MNGSSPLSEEGRDVMFSHSFEPLPTTFDAEMKDISAGLEADIGSEALMDILNCELTESCEASNYVNESEGTGTNLFASEVSDEDILNVRLH